MRSFVVLLALALSACAETIVRPPTPVEVQVATPVPCDVQHPECRAPAYNGARVEQEGDHKIKLLIIEAEEYRDCVKRYRQALEQCRAPVVP